MFYSHFQYATLLTDEAAAFLSLGRPAQAEQLLQESLHIMETLSGSQAAQNMAVTSYNLAMVLAMKGEEHSWICTRAYLN